MDTPTTFIVLIIMSLIGLIYVDAFRDHPSAEVAKIEKTFDNIDAKMDLIDAKLDRLIEKKEQEKQQ